LSLGDTIQALGFVLACAICFAIVILFYFILYL
jgi:hypothetical protein